MKYLELKYIKHPEKYGFYIVYITKQTHRGSDFYKGGRFKSENGFILKSSCRPQLESNCIYLRGYNYERDNDCMTIDLDCLEKLRYAVCEYNKMHSDKEEEMEDHGWNTIS